MPSNIKINQFSTGFLIPKLYTILYMYDYYYDLNIIKSKNIILIYLFDIILVVDVLYDTSIIYKISHKTILFKRILREILLHNIQHPSLL